MSVPPSHRCPTCKSASANPRNLVVFIDGTSNKPGLEDTNVVKLHSEVKTERESSEPEQITRYLKGIGAYEDRTLSPFDQARKVVYSAFEMAFAWNVEKNVQDAYRWLVQTYQKGDQIYLFGFSRGAYQVRKLASMLHEIGLVKREHENQVDSAYGHFDSIDSLNPQARQEAMKFRKGFCWQGVRIHFVGVWDTVSSLGLIKRDVHLTASETVTNACHFRHALALDERRVKFLPECFMEVNAYRSPVRSSRSSVGDVKEVWFPGGHSDVGGMSRLDNPVETFLQIDDTYTSTVHAGHVPLLWMRREACANGLVLKPETSIWDPEDVDCGRRDTMTIWWKILEFCPVRHQVSFSGIGKHKWRWHLSRPRLIIPGQHIHSSVLFGDIYTPSATLLDGVEIPMVPRIASDRLWTTELRDEGATTRLLTSLLGNKTKLLESLEKVLFLLDSSNGQAQKIPRPDWTRAIGKQPDFEKFVLTMIYAMLWDFPAPEEERRMNDARNSLRGILSSNDVRAFYVLRFSTKQARLRHFFDHDGTIQDVVRALARTGNGPCEHLFILATENLRFLLPNDVTRALDRTGNGPSDHLFLLVTESLRYLVEDQHVRNRVINQLSRPDPTKTEKTRLYATLEVKTPKRTIASLKLVVSLAQYQPELRQKLEPKILELAKVKNSPVGSAAIEALVALNVLRHSNIHFSNILSYLGNTLPRLDVEVGGTPSPGNGDLPSILQVKGSGWDKEKITQELVSTINSSDAHERTAATLALLKLCRNLEIREICTPEKVVHIFIKQLERKKTSLLAAYALNTCLTLGMVTRPDFPRVAQLIVAMLDKGWFDDAVGRVEGRHILDGLMTTDLKEQVINEGIVDTLRKKLEGGERHEVRMSLICLDILEKDNRAELTGIVKQAVANLTVDDKRTQRKGIKVLAALAQTMAGEQAIEPQVIEIVKKLLPSPGTSSLPRSQIVGPATALYDLCKNETLRDIIRHSAEFSQLKSARHAGAQT